MEATAVMGFGFPLMVFLLAVLPMFFTGMGAKAAPGLAIMAVMAFFLAAVFCVGTARSSAVEARHEIAPPPAEEQMFDAPQR